VVVVVKVAIIAVVESKVVLKTEATDHSVAMVNLRVLIAPRLNKAHRLINLAQNRDHVLSKSRVLRANKSRSKVSQDRLALSALREVMVHPNQLIRTKVIAAAQITIAATITTVIVVANNRIIPLQKLNNS
jgi:hypothetical protein